MNDQPNPFRYGQVVHWWRSNRHGTEKFQGVVMGECRKRNTHIRIKTAKGYREVHRKHLQTMNTSNPNRLRRNRRLARRIATELMSAWNGPDEKIFCGRIQLMRRRPGSPDGDEQNLGGRCFSNVVDTIQEILNRVKP